MGKQRMVVRGSQVEIQETEKQTGRVAENLVTLVTAYLRLKPQACASQSPWTSTDREKLFIPISLNMATFQIFLYLLLQ